MSEINTEIEILIEVLENKKKLLGELLVQTKKQEELLNDKEFNIDTFNETIEIKEKAINKIISIDEGFQMTFKNIEIHLKGHKANYKDKIEYMKKLIKEIGEKSVEILVLEEKNKIQFTLISNGEKSKMKDFRKSKQTVANYYSSMNNQKNVERSYFFDSKK